jgi:hypothetical protein
MSNHKNTDLKKHQAPHSTNQTQLAGFQKVSTIFDPEIVKKYSEMVPDAPKRILKILEENSKAERQVRLLPFSETLRRDWMGYSLTLSILLATCFFAWLGKPWLYGSTLVAFLGIVVRHFIIKPKKNNS